MKTAQDRYECPFPVPEEHLRMVGVIAAQWEWIERVLERAIAGVMEHDYRRVAMFLANISFNDKCDLFLAHGRVFEESHPLEWKEITTAIKGLREARPMVGSNRKQPRVGGALLHSGAP
jgi:hypothetical protein